MLELIKCNISIIEDKDFKFINELKETIETYTNQTEFKFIKYLKDNNLLNQNHKLLSNILINSNGTEITIIIITIICPKGRYRIRTHINKWRNY